MSRRAPNEFVFLGTGTAVPTPRRAPSGAIIAADDEVTLVDPGPGAVKRACDAGFPVERIDTVLLTHHHPDHCLDVVAVLFALKNPALAKRAHPLTILGGPGTKSLLERLRDVFGGWITLPPEQLTVLELAPGPFQLGALEAEATPIRHSPASLAYRVRIPSPDGSPFILALSGDTDVCPGAVEVARGADAYVLEAAFPDESPVEGHLTPRSAARIAAEAGCHHLILTHFYPPVDVEVARQRVGEIFTGRVTIAEDGLRIPLRAVESDP